MRDAFQQDLRATELDPDLLSTPFAVQTNWHVITGAPSSGKTTLIDQLASRGFRTIPESGRQYIEGELAKGCPIEEIRQNMAGIQIILKEMQREVEQGLPAHDLIFLDGAVPGSLAWYRAFGLNPNEMLPDCFHLRYASVFILASLPYEENGARDEDARIVDYLYEWLTRDYIALGYRITRVPVLPVQERLAFLLDRLAELGAI